MMGVVHSLTDMMEKEESAMELFMDAEIALYLDGS